MNKFTLLAVLILFGILLRLASAMPTESVPAVSSSQGDVRLVGYSLVSGLSGQGDSDLTAIRQVVANWKMSNRSDIGASKIENRDFALVMVTARIKPGVHGGEKADIKVSSLLDAKSLRGGTLLLTKLIGPDKNVYAEAAGALSSESNHPTIGTVTSGATMTRNASF